MSQKENSSSYSIDPFHSEKSLGNFLIAPIHSTTTAFLNNVICQIHSTRPEDRFDVFSSFICDWISSVEAPAFLLSSILFLISQVNSKYLLDETYRFSDLEWWLVFKSDYSLEHELDLRAKIAGRKVCRETYQFYFPIGNNKYWDGTHIVTAHPNPDLDTLVCSFWGWLDAFAAKVCNRLHIWNVPGTTINPTDLAFLDSLLGQGNYELLCKRNEHLELSAIHISISCPIVKDKEALFDAQDLERCCPFVIVTDENGFYLGEWSPLDTEDFLQLALPLTNLLEWFEMYVRVELLHCFSLKELNHEILNKLIDKIKNTKLHEIPTLKRYSQRMRSLIFDSLFVILGINKNASLEEFAIACSRNDIPHLIEFFSEWSQLYSLQYSLDHFSKSELHIIFSSIQNLLSCLDGVTSSWLQLISSAKVALALKQQVYGKSPRWITTRTSVKEVNNQLNSSFIGCPITVIRLNKRGQKIPVGMISPETKNISGTVSLRDFSNQEDLSICSSLQVISVIDHHKSEINTKAPATIIISDVQACSVLVAEMEIMLSDYHLCRDANESISAEREKIMAISLLAAIFDDTDLLSKAKRRDLFAAYRLLKLLNPECHKNQNWERAQSIQEQKRLILQSPIAHSIYKKFFTLREQNLRKIICSSNKKDIENIDALFSDTKKQGCNVLAGQSKLFLENWQDLKNFRLLVLSNWINYCKRKSVTTTPFCLHVMSTILSAEQILKDETLPNTHKDEMWLWVNNGHSDKGMYIFLEQLLEKELDPKKTNIEIINGNLNKEKAHPIIRDCASVEEKDEKSIEETLIILHFKTGALNSRKSSITPYIPNERP